MREVIDRILDGQYVEEDRGITVSGSAIELELQAGECRSGQFVITSVGDSMAEGTVVSSDPRMELLPASFEGRQVTIEYLFHGEYLEAGDEVNGSLYILSNRGEVIVSFHVSVSSDVMLSSIGPIKNLFHFANLAKSNWEEALHLFYSPSFRQVFHAADKKYDTDYRALSAYQMQSQNMEEFLIHVNKKQKLEYGFAPEEVQLEVLFAKNTDRLTEKEIVIHRNGWGYTTLEAEAEGEFIVLTKNVLTEDDFVGNKARFSFFLDTSVCREGKNQGRIRLFNAYTSLEIPVIVTVGERNLISRTRYEQKKGMLALCRLYENYRLRKINVSTWLKESNKIVDSIIALDEKDMRFRLFKAQLLITEGRANEAGWILKHVANTLEEAQETAEILEQKVYYLYLMTLLDVSPDYLEEVIYKVRMAYKQNRDDWRIGWLLSYLDEEIHDNPQAHLDFLEEMCLRGCSSFCVYIEALSLWNQNPALLRKLDYFEIMAIYYGAKHQNVSKDLAEQVIYLASKNAKYHPVLFRTMSLLMKDYKDPKILQIVCTMLITSGLYGRQYLPWYEEAIRQKCRITNLYEYYLMSVPMEEKCNLPKAVLLYFSYQNHLGPDHSAFLYRYIVERKDSLSDIYETYYVKIQQFVIAQLLKKRISVNLAYLYEKFITEDMLDNHMLEALSELAFSYELTIQDKRVQKVYVYQPMVKKPVEYPVSGGKCIASLYGEDCSIVFEDGYHNRFMDTVPYSTKKLFTPGKYMKQLKAYDGGISPDVYFAHTAGRNSLQTKEEALRAKRIFLNNTVDTELRLSEAMMLMEYLYSSDLMEQLDGLLIRLMELPLEKKDRTLVLKYMVLRARYAKTYELLNRYGVESADTATLLRFVGGMTADENREKDPILTAACSYVLKQGKYNGAVLDYLGKYYTGPVKGLYDIYAANRTFGVDNYRVAERILIQLLYTGAYLGERNEVFKYYVAQGAGDRLEKAYLAQTAYNCFVRERMEADFLFQEMFLLYRRGEELPLICKTAFLKYCSELMQEERKDYLECIREWFAELMQKGIRFSFMQKLSIESERGELEDKTIIEYRTVPGTRAKIHYVIVDDLREDGDYRSEYMSEVFPGLYVKKFVLFYGETLQYYIMEERDGESSLTESSTIQKNEFDHHNGNTRYEMINDILMSRSMQDYDTLDKAIEDYLVKDYYNEQLFVKK